MINEKRLLDTFVEYVQIDSETLNEKQIGEKLVADLQALGLTVDTDNAGAAFGSNGFNVHAYIEGELGGDPLIFSAHMDTVKPGNGIKPIITDGLIHTDGTTILAGDDKCGIAAVVEAVRTVIENKLPHRNIEILFTIAEEGGLRGAKHLDYGMVKGKDVVVLDAGGEVGSVITACPGQTNIQAKITGKTAHAGIAPETGISAIQVAAKGIANMNLLRIDEETTCNIGTIKAEFATNIVPDKCEVIAEVRSRNLDKLNAQTQHIVDCLQAACDEMGATLECETSTNYISFDVPLDDVLVKMIEEACGRLDLPFSTAKGGGGSDANVMALHGFKSVVLGVGMTNVHTCEECLKVDDLNKTAALCLDLMIH